ncbi:lysine:proton symporter (AAT family) [Paraburkholderia eburnea]|uniref:Lysine:proton symporter (AAT family) n=1 Tax=Paraburkholderia eburnea TaxID=1189126 RepID=A0A2S4M911_9BURK|nr:amino acid permease [Paraburkholderia eburnea]POR51151.1 lysine:proton symporter (AAT family) [Paraburkholderia eburnea]PRZ21885.1 lysine:proton symporter (AAT family) [Paraburkholderia eburnea]
MDSDPHRVSGGTSRSGDEPPSLHRSLKARHLTMIAIGGSIGTGLFVASGASISQAGPGGALAAYLVIGLMVYFLMTSLGEMAAFMPVSGSFATYGAKFVDEGFGFALGWNYWYNWAVTIAVELVASQLVMGYWFPHVPGVWWSAGFLAIMFLLNALSVRGFGEAEYWFSLIKVVTVVAFIGVGLFMIVGVMKGGADHVWGTFTSEGGPFVGGLPALLGVTMIAGFSFQGTELIGVAAGESENPGKTIPRAVRQVFWRILLFYVLAIIVIGLLIPHTDPNLLKSDVTDIGVSPFTLVFRRAGLALSAGVMNAVILTAVLSAGNSGMYASTRMLYNLAVEGRAPRIFAKLSSSGVPRNALYATTAVGALCFLSSMYGDKTVYMWLLNTSGMTGFIAWLGIAVSHYRFRKGFVAQGLSFAQLPYRSKWFPIGPIFAFVVCLVIMLGQDYQAFTSNKIDWASVLATYIGIPLFALMWLGYRIVKGSRFIRYDEMEISPLTGQTGARALAEAKSEA